MDPNAWPQLRKVKGSFLLRPIKRPRPDSDTSSDQNDHTAQKPRHSGTFEDMVCGLDFKVGLQKDVKTKRRVFSEHNVPRRVQATDVGLVESAVRSGGLQAFANATPGPSRDVQNPSLKKPVMLTPLRAPPRPFSPGFQTSSVKKSTRTPSTPLPQRVQNRDSSPSPARTMSPMMARIPNYHLPKQSTAFASPLKKAMPPKVAPALDGLSDSAHAITDRKDVLEAALARERDKGKGKAKEMKAITEAKLEIDWADGNFLFNREERPEGEVEFVGRDARERELTRGLVLSPQKCGKSGKGGRFVRGGLAETAQRLFSRSRTDRILWSREVERLPISDAHVHCDSRVRVLRILSIPRDNKPKSTGTSRSRLNIKPPPLTVLAECEVLDCELDSPFSKSYSPSGSKPQPVIAPPPWVVEHMPPPEAHVVRILFSESAGRGAVSGPKLFGGSIGGGDVDLVSTGAEICIWKPWYVVVKPPADGSGGADDADRGFNSNCMTIFCSRILVVQGKGT